MLNNLLHLGLNTIEAVSASALQAQRGTRAAHPLAGYPKLLNALSTAERSGMLSAERRTLHVRQLSN